MNRWPRYEDPIAGRSPTARPSGASEAALVDWHDAVRHGARLLEAAVREMVRRRTHEPLPQRGRPPPRGARRPEGARLHLHRDRREQKTLHVRASSRRGEPRSPRSFMRAPGVGRGRSRADLHADDRRGGRSRCSPARGSARSTRSCSAASPRRASRRGSTTRRPKLMVTSDAGMRAGKPVPYKHLVDEAIRLARQPAATGPHRQSRARHGDDRSSPAAISTTRALRART